MPFTYWLLQSPAPLPRALEEVATRVRPQEFAPEFTPKFGVCGGCIKWMRLWWLSLSLSLL